MYTRTQTEPRFRALRLVAVTIEGYRSIRGAIRFVVEPNATVILGANDHGKSNLLQAIRHLNPDQPYTSDDLNWDCDDMVDRLPSLTFEMALEPEERAGLRDLAMRQGLAGALAELEAGYQQQAEGIEAELGQLTGTESPEAAMADTSAPEPVRPESEELSGAAKLEAERDEARQVHAVLAFLSTSGTNESELESRVTDEILRRSTLFSEADEALTQARASVNAANQKKTAADPTGDSEAIAKATAELTAAQDTFKSTRARRAAAERERDLLANGWERLRDILGKSIRYPNIAIKDLPETIFLSRMGLEGPLKVPDIPGVPTQAVEDLVRSGLPRVELIGPTESVSDSVTAEELSSGDHYFMRGIFHYAGLPVADWPSLFVQNNSTVRKLRDASEVLDTSLRSNWSQGSQLVFRLIHHSSQKRIKLSIQDSSVTTRDVDASKRSSGFTHFFGLKTILYARQQEKPANSYIWLFDEPGIYLHPDGQADLIRVLETIGQHDQVMYSTHSIFMLNRNFPTRHRLLVKDERGTCVDGKPFIGNWYSALQSLGFGLPATVLFAPKVLLVEGDSDPILLWAVLQRLSRVDQITFDTNLLSIMATGNSRNADALIRILSEGVHHPEIAAVFDGDDGGRDRVDALKPLTSSLGIQMKTLPKGQAIEDLLPLADRLLPEATAQYLSKLSHRPVEELLAELRPLAGTRGEESWAKWTREVGDRIGAITGPVSPIGIAREYVQLLEAAPDEEITKGSTTKIRNVLSWVESTLSLGGRTLTESDQSQILADSEAAAPVPPST